MSSLFRIYPLEEARQSILLRVPPDEFDVPRSVAESIEAVFGEPLSPEQAVRRIVTDVRAGGDPRLRYWTERIDGVRLEGIAVTAQEIETGAAGVAPEIVDALRFSAARIERFYRQQPLTSWFDAGPEGLLGQVILPIERVGVYVPGGTAPLPSSLLMSAIPARVAGVEEIIVCTPPGKDGSVPAVILAAAHIAGIEQVFRIGGAQAIAAMAYGTESVPRVNKVVGPGGLFVTLAKRQVYGGVGIDGLLGPTETMIIADEHADPARTATDLLAQAEHDILAQAILVTPSRALAETVADEITKQAARLSRRAIIEESLRQRGGAIIVPDLETAFAVANEYAAEHLQLSIKEPTGWLGKVRHAGAIFLGEMSCEVLGDYVAGPSHSLPTGGTAHFASGLNVWDFVKVTSVIGLGPDAAASLSERAAVIARAEQLTAHAAAAEARSTRR